MKKLIFGIITFCLILLICFAVAETFIRLTLGKRLIVQVEESGLYHFKENQNGWYHLRFRTPTARINNIGARGDDFDISSKEKKYIFLGDSYTFGWELTDQETTPYYYMLETGNNVLNYANGGFGHEHIFLMYEHYKNYFNKGDEIIFIITRQSFERVVIMDNSKLKPLFWKVKDKSQSIAWTWAIIRYIAGNFDENHANPEKIRELPDNKVKMLLDFKDKVEADGFKMKYVFYEYEKSGYSRQMEQVCKENNMECICDVYEITERANKINAPIYSADGGHPSAQMNHFLAEKLILLILLKLKEKA